MNMGGSRHTDHLMQILPIGFLKRQDHQATDGGHQDLRAPRGGVTTLFSYASTPTGSHLLAAASFFQIQFYFRRTSVFDGRFKNKGRDLHDAQTDAARSVVDSGCDYVINKQLNSVTYPFKSNSSPPPD
ncbi:hypothetical protein fugu_003403 [Takifugu bimaculatus]|uniref:Uncharacterized protein n=1 Tax=Takifugu bimaculatus TaxID=433685 RepID=A0A4Z2BFF3_9TELE|nr:hypothetical protein fugu_003403 [Takifugu bimaculatus]